MELQTLNKENAVIRNALWWAVESVDPGLIDPNYGRFVKYYVGGNSYLWSWDTTYSDGDALRAELVRVLMKTNDGSYATYSPFSYFYNKEGENWWAEAIKGDTGKLYPVINKYAKGTTHVEGESNPSTYNGDVVNNFSGETTQGLALDGQDYISGFRGLGLEIYSIGFALGTTGDNCIQASTMNGVLSKISSGTNNTDGTNKYFFLANDQNGLISALNKIVNNVTSGASKMWFTDTMGEDFDLLTGNILKDREGNDIVLDFVPTVRVNLYNADINGKPTTLIRTLEKIEFTGTKTAKSTVYNDDGTVTTVDDVWDDATDMISGSKLHYNAGTATYNLKLDDSGLTYPLAPETFFWTIGNLPDTAISLEYQIYLTGSMEGKYDDYGITTIHDTNESAVLHYRDVLGNDVTQAPESPTYTWDPLPGKIAADKTVESVAGTTDVFDLTMEGYVNGSVEQVTVTKPADIVLVLDHSGSMRTPSGAPKVLNTSELYSTTGHLPSDQLDKSKGTHMGYYVAQSTASNAWFIMQYADSMWHFYSVPSTESIVSIDGGWTEHTQHLSWSQEQLKTDSAAKNLVYYYSQYAVLYDSVLNFVDDLRASGVEHSVAIVGFSGPNSQGSRVYVSGYNSRTGQEETSYKSFNAMYHNNTSDERRAELYQMAMKNVQDDTQYNELLANIEAIETNFSFTCPSSGLKLADDLYQANAANRDTDRDRIMVLFTDGIPNRSAQDWVSDKNEDNADGSGATSKLTQTQIYDEIISMAHKIKAAPENGGHGATIYSVSTTTLVNTTAAENDPRTFLHYASSDYPDATSLAASGNPIAEPKYTSEVNGVDDLELMFDSVTKEVAGTQIELDATAVLKDTLTDYFELTDDVKIDVYTQKYLGDDKWAEPVAFPNAVIEVTSSVEGGRLDTVSVSGFDYSQEFISEMGRTQTTTDENGQPVTVENYQGSKLVVKVRVKARDGFWGGNNVPTNKNDAGIYGEGNDLISKFPEPQVNVPVKPVITGKDVTVYYGEDKVDALDDLVEKITIGTTVNENGEEEGIEVTYDRENNKFVPKEDWMDDFADLSWNPDLLNPADPNTTVSGKEPDDYTFGVVLTPKTDGSANDNGTGSNIAGTPVDPDDGVASDEATGSVDVLVPVIKFEDSTIDLGDLPDDTYYETTNRKDNIQWVNKEDPYGKDGLPTTATPGFNNEPEITVTYTPVTNEQGYFTKDTPVNVEVYLGEDTAESNKMTHEVYFDWTGCDNDDLHDDHETVADDEKGDELHRHKGDVSSNEFYVHVTYILNADTVVIDFGLKVDIDVLKNDQLPDGTCIDSITFGDQIPAVFTNGIAGGYSASEDGGHGVMTVVTENGKSLLRYTPSDTEMNVKEVFIYAVANGTGADARFYYTPVTVIPASVIYYEDNFLDYSIWESDGNGGYTATYGDNTWNTVGTAQDDTQAEDRPGQALDSLDANNIYGYDAAYTDMTTYSNGAAKWVTVNNDTYAEATFQYWGTGFDIISLTNSNSGTILVSVEDLVGGTMKYYMVDTYYGYKYNAADKKWEVDTGDSDTLYQVPVMKVDNGTYSHYKVTINCSYGDLFDHGQNSSSGSYNFYLDAIRIYNPAQQAEDGSISDSVIDDAYHADFEANPTYTELRDMLIQADTFNQLGEGEKTAGIIFIDGNKTLSDGENGSYESVQESGKTYAVSEYINYGPNNELYLAPNQAVSFTLGQVGVNGRVHLALKSVGDFGDDEGKQDGVENNDGIGDNSGSATVEIYGINPNGTRKSILTNDQMTVNTATDLYYDITALAGTTVVIRNKGNAGIVSVTNIKTTNTPAMMMLSVSRDSVTQALAALNEGDKVPVEPTEGSISMRYATLSFEDEIVMNAYFTLEGIEVDPSRMGMIAFSSDAANGTVDNAEAIFHGGISANGCYCVSTQGIPAKNLGDTIYFRIYARLADGSYVYSAPVSYSPNTYANSVLNGNYSVEMKALVVAMLNYGAAAQTYFHYNTDALVNRDLTDAHKALVADYADRMLTDVETPSVYKQGNFVNNGGYISAYPAVSFEGAFATTITSPPVQCLQTASRCTTGVRKPMTVPLF